MNLGFIHTNECVNVAPSADPRCGDPAFALANPDVCPGQSKLIIKPGAVLTCALGSIQFGAFMVTNGVEEDVTAEAVFSTSNPNVAVIGARSGNCTGVSQGTVTVSAAYGTYTATADMTVIGTSGDCCSEQQVAMMVLVDASRSMSQAFSGSYSSRLAFAKAAATRFIGEVNTEKDIVGLMSFTASSFSTLSYLKSDRDAVAALVPGIAQSQQKTAFYDALDAAMRTLNDSSADRKVIVLISDGEDTSTGAASGYEGVDNPIELLSEFKSLGGIVICLGCRASGSGFDRLSYFATGGFFINAYPSIEEDSLGYLSGLKGYVCAGNCTPAGDVTVPSPSLDYDAFANWNVTGGHVDLLGPGLFDLLPGNGLYVDLAGSSVPAYGRITTKVPISIVTGQTYRVMAQLAGNQRREGSPYIARLRVYYGEAQNELVHQEIVINDHTQDFHDYSFTFTATADVDVYIEVSQVSVPLETPYPLYGLLLGKVTFDNTSTLTNLFSDDFDDENPTYIPPRCNAVTGLYGIVSYNCYGGNGSGCLSEPPPSQIGDPSPLPDIESGFTPPKEYSSSQSRCATCVDGFLNVSSTPIELPVAGDILQVNENQYAFVCDVGSPQQIAGYTLFGTLWGNGHSFDPIDGWVWIVEGSNDNSSWHELHRRYSSFSYRGSARFPVNDATTPYRYFRFRTWVTSCPTVIKVFAPAPIQVCQTASATSFLSQSDADSKAAAAALEAANAGLNCAAIYSATETYSAHCRAGTFGGTVVQKTATAVSYISLADAQAEASAIAQQLAEELLDCTGSNNTERILIPKAGETEGEASPYPSVLYVDAAPESIAKVTVTLLGLTHQSVNDIFAILVAPDKTSVLLCQFGGGMNLPAISAPINLTFDDAGANFQNGVAPATGSYKPYSFAPTGVGGQFPAPYNGATNPSTTMAAFNGKNGNGSWSLWVFDGQALLTGQIAGGWTLNIT